MFDQSVIGQSETVERKLLFFYHNFCCYILPPSLDEILFSVEIIFGSILYTKKKTRKEIYKNIFVDKPANIIQGTLKKFNLLLRTKKLLLIKKM